ncbi:hypothetical protein [Salidesulfovibrio onnuriiensis]|uniref:hypothetical protein n=1 Tax=Salidesulfovibrio onnuriiensis TaxID=2583823 RepID=UPI0011CA2A8E|nr:hypothetical protein [Salidesulfovibrio onnuriiensis]
MERVNRFGTTSDMVIQEIEHDGVLKLLAIDAKGLYLTTPERVGAIMADVNRYGVDRRQTLELLQSRGLSPAEIFEANKDKIKVVGLQERKKINPLKASKRGL